MMHGIRSKAFGALRSSFGRQVAPVRWTKDFLLFVNEMAGMPLAPADDLAGRRAREQENAQKLREAREKRLADLREQAAGAKKEQAPVVVYKDDKSRRELERIRGVLRGRSITFQELDVEHDQASKSWVRTTAGADELPIVFVAGKPLGAYDQLVQLDVTGELNKMVFGG